MDCANSGSLQYSSSGGDEEYDDSRAAVSILMNTHSPSRLRPIATASVAPLLYSLPIPHPNYIQLQNPNTPRPATMRSDPNPSSGIMEPPTITTVSRKRARASRREYPTTVLTTDTTNFRAMVQHFTGIHAPPFNETSASLSTTRFHLFGAARSTGFFEPPPPFLVSSSTATTSPINYQLPLIQNPNTSDFPCCFLQSNPKFVFSCSNAIASKPHEHDQDQDSLGNPTLYIDDFDFIDQNHA